MAAQKFTLPTMPFRREVHNGCAIGTSILINAKPFQDNNKGFTVQLCSAADIALNMSVPVNKEKKMTVTARLNGQFTSEIQKDVYLPYNKPFVLHIRLNTHVSEVYLNDQHLLDFVHRVNPLEIKEVCIEGPLIIDEVTFRPPQGASLDELPAYNDVANHSLPINEMQNMNLGSTSARPPTTAPLPPPISSIPQRGPPGQPGSLPYPPAGPNAGGLPYPMPAGNSEKAGSGQPYPYPEKPSPYGAAAPRKGEKDPYGRSPAAPVAQIAPQPTGPGVSSIGLLNAAASNRSRSPLGQYGSRNPVPYTPEQAAGSYPSSPQPGSYQPPTSQPGGYPRPPTSQPAGYPSSTTQPGGYPPPTSQPGAYPYGASQPTGYPGQPGAPSGAYPQYPSSGSYPQGAAAYPGTSGMSAYPQPMGYAQPTVYAQPVYQQSYPYAAPVMYPGYYGGYEYYDDCHHHHHHC